MGIWGIAESFKASAREEGIRPAEKYKDLDFRKWGAWY